MRNYTEPKYQCSLVKFYWEAHAQLLRAVRGCFCIPTAQLSGYSRDSVLQSRKCLFTNWPFAERVG